MDLAQMLAASALMRGRVLRFDRLEKSIPFVPVQDHGIDLRRHRSCGITGYQAENLRKQRERARNAEIIMAVLEKAEKRQKEIPQHVVIDPIRPSIRLIQWHVCSFSNTTRNDLLSSRRTADVVKPRQIGMILAKMLTHRSLPEIGREFGNRHHTTVLYAVRKTANLQNWILARRKPGDEIDLWVSDAFKGWDELGLH